MAGSADVLNAMLRKVQGDEAESQNGLNTLIKGVSLAQGFGADVKKPPEPTPEPTPPLSSPPATPEAENNVAPSGAAGPGNQDYQDAILRRQEQMSQEGPIAIENGIKALDQVDQATREKLAPALLQARYKARGFDVGGIG